jgi:hypothetical protein
LKQRNRFLAIGSVLVLSVILAACGGDNSTATPQPTATAVAQVAAPTDTAASSNTGGAGATTVATATTAMSATAAAPVVMTVTTTEGGTARVLGDTGFRAAANGYSFRNFGNQYPTSPPTFSVDAARALLGDAAICASVSGGTCTPSPLATQWIDQMNKGINGGHCEGFAVSSMLIYKGLDKASDYGGANIADLKLDPADPNSNPKLLSLIADGWTLQTLEPVRSTRISSVTQTPNQILDAIIAAMQNGAPDPLILAFWKPGYKEGHAVVPIWAEDKGNGVVLLHIYDNNYPAEDKYIIFDRNAQTWTYSTAADPTKDASAYIGDASTQTLAVASLSSRTKPAVCPFCKNASGNGLLAPAAGQQMEQVMVDGNAEMLFTDKNGNKFGYDNGKLVGDIPNASMTFLPGGLGHDHGPIYDLPEGADYQSKLQGGDVVDTNTEEIAVFGQGMAFDAQGIKLDSSHSDSLSVSSDGHKIGYTPGSAEIPEVKIADDSGAKDYGFDLTGIDFSPGEEVDFSVDDTTGKLAIKDTTGTPDMYNLSFTEVDASGTHTFKHNDIPLNPGDTEYIDFGTWTDGGAVNIGVDQGSNGTIDQTLSEPEQP